MKISELYDISRLRLSPNVGFSSLFLRPVSAIDPLASVSIRPLRHRALIDHEVAVRLFIQFSHEVCKYTDRISFPEFVHEIHFQCATVDKLGLFNTELVVGIDQSTMGGP
jgi:hypothetical protein